MKIQYYFRYPNNLNRSIERVFEAVISGIQQSSDIKTESIFAKAFKFWPLAMIYNIVRMGIKSWKKDQINHITGDIHYVSLMMPKSHTVLTIHDLVILHDYNAPKWLKKFVYYVWYYLPLKHLKHITCISEETRKDLIKFFPFAESKVSVIPNPILGDYTSTPLPNNNPPTILHIGTRPNKNLERVIEAVSTLKCHLRILGRLTEEQMELLNRFKINYSNTFGISDNDIIKEYEKCDIVSFPSLFEGFGMPIIEGQASGRPVLTSNIEPMKSVAGNCAVLVNPNDIKDIRRGFSRLIDSPEYRKVISDKGIVNTEKYSSANIAEQYINYYSNILNVRY